MKNPESTVSEEACEIVIQRVFDAPRAVMWVAWTEREHLAEWWGPRHFKTRVSEMDLKPGGLLKYVMIAPDGAEYPGRHVFREVVPPERLVLTAEFGDDFKHPNVADFPKGVVMNCLFEDLGDKTGFTLRITHATPDDRRKHAAMEAIPGWNSSLDCLANHLATMVAKVSK
jgi:uncharacterized protein YndB with AHSA1/START domain